MGNRITAGEAKRILDAFWEGEWQYVDDNIGQTSIRINGKIIHLFIVVQNRSYEIESERGHLFAPRKWHPNMLSVNPEDIIFHSDNGMIKAISVALETAEETYGTTDGLRIDCYYSEMETPLDVKPLRPKLADVTPFTSRGYLPMAGYIHHLHAFAAKLLLTEIKKLGNHPRE